jgi:hypothetical protein
MSEALATKFADVLAKAKRKGITLTKQFAGRVFFIEPTGLMGWMTANQTTIAHGGEMQAEVAMAFVGGN